MLQIKNFYLRVMDTVNKVIAYMLSLLLAVMVIVIFSQVFSRFILESSIVWSEEFARYVMIWGVFLGVGYAARLDLLIAVKVLPEFLPSKPKKVVNFIVQFMMLLFGTFLTYYGILMAINVVNQISPAMGVSMAIPYSAIPLGGILVFLNAIAVLLSNPEKEREII